MRRTFVFPEGAGPYSVLSAIMLHLLPPCEIKFIATKVLLWHWKQMIIAKG
jgi:hypothetical protein